MKTVRLALLAVCLACGGGGDKATAPTQQGTLIFKLDPVTCVGTGAIELFVDGTSQGQYTFSPGTQKGFPVQAGPHTAGAREASAGGYVWPTQNVNVPANSTWTTLLVC